jgi:hypothetical protein
MTKESTQKPSKMSTNNSANSLPMDSDSKPIEKPSEIIADNSANSLPMDSDSNPIEKPSEIIADNLDNSLPMDSESNPSKGNPIEEPTRKLTGFGVNDQTKIKLYLE